MDHVVYVDTKSKELENIVDGTQSMIIRGATGRKLPYGRVNPGDILYFIRNNGEGEVKAKAIVTNVFNSEKMDNNQSVILVEDNQSELQLSKELFDKWAGKRYLVLIRISNIESIISKKIDRSNYGNMDDWLPVDDINCVIMENLDI
ncbi:MAG: hypothetical protein KAH21_11820 [Spirochaetaceae bacterium]|nr:hypothetical protein [Spirochaetaceae bacterium]